MNTATDKNHDEIPGQCAACQAATVSRAVMPADEGGDVPLCLGCAELLWAVASVDPAGARYRVGSAAMLQWLAEVRAGRPDLAMAAGEMAAGEGVIYVLKGWGGVL